MMKKSVLKKAAAVMAAALMVFSLSATSFAEPTARPKPGTETTATTSTTTETLSTSTAKENKEDKDSDRTETSAVEEKSYTTKGGAFLWFLLSVIVNTIISFAIANRFYKLTRRSNHVQSELRALRRDVEEKFANSVGGFVEPNVDITNTNDDYSMNEDGIKMTPASTVSVDDEPEDIYKQWEAQFGARYAARKAEVSEREEETFEEPRARIRKYQPTREASREEGMSVRERLAARRAQRMAEPEAVDEIEEIEDEDFEERETISGKISGIGSKAKQFLGGIFPFDEDDDE